MEMLCCSDDDLDEFKTQTKNNENLCLGANPFLDIPISTNAVEYKKGYVMRKCCYEANAKRSEFPSNLIAISNSIPGNTLTVNNVTVFTENTSVLSLFALLMLKRI